MKRLLFLFLALFMINSANAAKNETGLNLSEGNKTMNEVSVKDYEAVKQALNNYLEAGRKGDSKILRSSAYKDAIMYSAADGKVEGGSINALFEYIDGNPAAPDIEADITSVDIAGNIAYAKVESNNWHGARYTDMFLLVKEGNDWKILTKVFHTHK
ncbi:MAG: nuclear transport factor 2 family protein [Acetobacter sp.]|nr:nuclear transport factor 2 family protein [Acetobacter sp.]